LHQVGDLFELNVKLRCQKIKLFIQFIHRRVLHKFDVSEKYS